MKMIAHRGYSKYELENTKENYVVMGIHPMDGEYHILDTEEELYELISLAKESEDEINETMEKEEFQGFIPIRVSCIVNIEVIFSIEKDTLVLDNKKVLFISRRKVKSVKEMFQQKTRRNII